MSEILDKDDEKRHDIYVHLHVGLSRMEKQFEITMKQNPEAVYIMWIRRILSDAIMLPLSENGIFDYDHNLLHDRLWTLKQSLDWAFLSVLSGAYVVALRNLRAAFEDIIQAIYIDQIMPAADVDAKFDAIKILEDCRLRGTKLIEKCEMPSTIQQSLTRLYQQLSGIVHPSQEVIDLFAMRGGFAFSYDETKFDECLRIHMKVFDINVALRTKSFNSLIIDVDQTLDF